MALAQSGGARPALMPVAAIDYVSGYLMAYGVMVALGRRAREGGSWLVEVSLARTARWIVDQGIAAGYSDVADELPDEDVQRLTVEANTPLGRIRHLGSVLALSETPPFWARPPVPLGHHPPEWPPRP
jgi:crotonobetainyl-CoA:carnitine CoA-transferase CaiB-like acyl-CoA transferase